MTSRLCFSLSLCPAYFTAYNSTSGRCVDSDRNGNRISNSKEINKS